MLNVQEPAVPQQGEGGLLRAAGGAADPVRVRLRISYDGGPFAGWAKQPGRRTVQGSLEEGLSILLRHPVRIAVAGRTDAGVHAGGQMAHFDLSAREWGSVARGRDLAPGVALRRRLQGVLSMVLGEHAGAIEVHAADAAPAGFDARFSALWRRYSYRIADRLQDRNPLTRTFTLWYGDALDINLLNAAAAPLLGLQDFAAYAKPRPGATTIRELQRLDFTRGPDGVIVATVQADAFCHNMVRYLIGAALDVGAGNREPEWMRQRQLSGLRGRNAIIAPPHPLVLEEVGYPDHAQMGERAQLTRARRQPPSTRDVAAW